MSTQQSAYMKQMFPFKLMSTSSDEAPFEIIEFETVKKEEILFDLYGTSSVLFCWGIHNLVSCRLYQDYTNLLYN